MSENSRRARTATATATATATEAAAGEPLSKARLRLWLKLLKVSRAVEDDVRRRLRADYGSTLPRFDVMSALDRYPDGLKMSQISELLRVSNGNVTGIVDRLAEEGLALRVPVPGDRRAALVRLTARGREVFALHAAAHERWIDQRLGGLGAADLEAMSRGLDLLRAARDDREDATDAQ